MARSTSTDTLMNTCSDAGLARRRLLLGGAVGLLLGPAGLAGAAPAARSAPLMQVWKGPACGCCKDWIELLRAQGLRVEVHEQGNSDARARLGIALQYGSCHTALIGGYAIEGHVPVREILRLLKERPEAIGLAVPGMPLGSPGMDGPEYGGRRDPYQVLLLSRDGRTRVYQNYP
jgi:hypothetical protein